MTLIDHSSLPRPVQTKNSSDLERGAAPRSIADEFVVWTGLGNEVWSIKIMKPSQKCYTYWEPDWEEVNEKLKKLQLATAQARLSELERRAAGETNRARKERERKKKQKAAKQAAAGQTEQQRREQQRAAAQDPAQSEMAQQLWRVWRSSIYPSARRRPEMLWHLWQVAAAMVRHKVSSQPSGWRH